MYVYTSGGGSGPLEYGDTDALLNESKYDSTMTEDDVEFHKLLDQSDSLDGEDVTADKKLVNEKDGDAKSKGDDLDDFEFESPSSS